MTASSLSSRSLLRVVAALVAAGIALLLSPAIAAHAAGDDATWTVRTASNAFGSDRTSYGYTVDPGANVEDAIVVANHGDAPLDLSVYASDGYTTDSGQFDLLVAGATSVGIGAWLHTDAGTVTIPAGRTVEIPFTVSVPDNATPGDYAGGIVTSLGAQQDAEGISVDRRLGIRVMLRVGGALAPGLAVEDPRIEWGGGFSPAGTGDATLTYTLHNTGNTLLSAQQSAVATGPFGWFPVDAGDIDAPPQLLPGETWTVSVPIRGVPAVFWLAGTASITPLVTDASGSTTPLDVVTGTAVGWAVPWLLVIVAVVVAGLIVLIVRLRRRGRATRQAQEDARVQAAVEQALAEKERVG